MISTFQRNRHFKKVSVNKTFTLALEQKKRCCGDIPLTFRLVKNHLKIHLINVNKNKKGGWGNEGGQFLKKYLLTLLLLLVNFY